MSTPGTATGDGPVALVVQRRIDDAGFAAFTRWSGTVAEALQAREGFLGQETIPPQPPAHVDWVQIQRFASAAAARTWLQSAERAALLDGIRGHFIGSEDIHILPDAGGRHADAVSAIISCRVPSGREADFLAWQARVQAAEARYPGFLRHKVERPIPGLHDDWVVILSFDTDEHMNAWMDSPERRTLVAEGAGFSSGLSVRRASYGFDFWFPADQAAGQGPGFIFKSNLIVLLVLYPVVFLWGFFISRPFIDAAGIPFWLSLFIGNVASTQLLGWWIAPAAFRALDWWIRPDTPWRKNVAGYALLAALYALSMAAFAGLLAWNWGSPG